MPGDGACTVTPGLIPVDGHTYTDADFRALGKPVVSVANGAIGVSQLDPAAKSALSGGGGSGSVNFFLNGNFADPLWERGIGPVTCAVAADTYLADNWFANPAGAAITYEQSAVVPNDGSLFSAKLTGATGATAVKFGQNIPRHVSAQLRQTITVSLYLRNDSGSAFVPSLVFSTPTAANDFTSLAVQSTETLQSCPNTAWTLVTATVDASLFSNMTNGLRVELLLPSGTLGGSGKTVNVAQGQLEIGGTATAFPPAYDLASTQPGLNLFHNGDLDEPLWGAASSSCPVGLDTVIVQDWFCNPAGAAVTLARSTTVPNATSLHSAQITGASSVDVVDFGQNLIRSLSAQLRRKVTFSAQIRNDTGGAIVPSLRVSSANSANDFSATTIRTNTPLASCPNNAWTKVTLTFNGAVTDADKGLRIAVRFPSGALDSGGKSVCLAQLKLETGEIPTAFLATPVEVPALALLGSFRNLAITNGGSPDTQVAISADELVLKNAAGFPLFLTNFAPTVDIMVSGANGLDTGSEGNVHYFIWAISTGVTHRGLLSISATSPMMPAGYSYKALLGSVFNSAGNFVKFQQFNREVWIAPMNVLNAVPGAGANNWNDLSLDVIPPNAKSVRGNYGSVSASRAQLAADHNFLGSVVLALADTAGTIATNADTTHNVQASAPFEVPVTTAQQISWRSPNVGVTHIIDITGWTL